MKMMWLTAAIVATGVGVGLGPGVGVGAAAVTPKPWQPVRNVKAKNAKSDTSRIFLQEVFWGIMINCLPMSGCGYRQFRPFPKEQQLYSKLLILFLGKTLAGLIYLELTSLSRCSAIEEGEL